MNKTENKSQKFNFIPNIESTSKALEAPVKSALAMLVGYCVGIALEHRHNGYGLILGGCGGCFTYAHVLDKQKSHEIQLLAEKVLCLENTTSQRPFSLQPYAKDLRENIKKGVYDAIQYSYKSLISLDISHLTQSAAKKIPSFPSPQETKEKSSDKAFALFKKGLFFLRELSYNGPLVGLTLGSAVRILQTGSFTAKAFDYSRANGLSGLLGKINASRDSHIVPIHIVIPHLITLVFQEFLSKEKSHKPDEDMEIVFKNMLGSAPIEFYDLVSTFCLSLALREVATHILPRSIDVSGHAVVQCLSWILLQKNKAFIETHKRSIPLNLYDGFNGSMGMVEGLWTFSTVAYYHSVADMLSAIGLVGAAYLIKKLCYDGLQTARQTYLHGFLSPSKTERSSINSIISPFPRACS